MIRRRRRTIRQRVRTMEEGVGGGGAITGGELLRLMEDLRGNAQLALATRRYFSPQSTGTEITDKRNFTIKILILLLQRHA